MAEAKQRKDGGVTLRLSLDEAQWVADVLMSVDTDADPVFVALDALPPITNRISYRTEGSLRTPSPDGRADA